MDPIETRFERPGNERRTHPRSPANYLLHIAAHRGKGAKPLVAKGEVVDQSLSGIRIHTKHSLQVGELVDLAIPTKGCPIETELPKAFLGKARVARVEPLEEDVAMAALSVDRELIDDMNYARFVEFHRRSHDASK